MELFEFGLVLLIGFAIGFFLLYGIVEFSISDGELNLGDGRRFVQVDAEPEVTWCEEWEFFNCEPEVCNEGSVSDSQSFILCFALYFKK